MDARRPPCWRRPGPALARAASFLSLRRRRIANSLVITINNRLYARRTLVITCCTRGIQIDSKMPSNKKKGAVDKKKRQQERHLKRGAAQEFRVRVVEFRDLLLKGRKEYAKGRAYDAVEYQTQALALGGESLPRFEEDSLIKAHALLELALAKSAIQTDFATGDEWRRVHREGRKASREALEIFERRAASGTLTLFRREECWIDSSEYASPVPHTERLGPVDYLQCVNFLGLQDPTRDTVRSIKLAMDFVRTFVASGHVIRLQVGGALEGALTGGEMDMLTACLREHQAVVSGRRSTSDARDRLFGDDDREELRHTGSLEGKMKSTHRKLAKDVDRIGLRHCAYPDCGKMESQPRQFSTCSRCGWAAYCSKDCQKGDWKRHKKECKSGKAAEEAQREESQNKSRSSLMVGQSQQVLCIITYLHHFAATSEKLLGSKSIWAERVLLMINPKFNCLPLGTLQLGVQDTSFIWNAIWSMETKQRKKMFRDFIERMRKFRFPRGGPDFEVVAEWGLHGVSGDFAVVEHTKTGSVLLHTYPEAEDGGGIVRGYLAVGITQSIESLLVSMPDPSLPVYVNTALFPFKRVILCQGTLHLAQGDVSVELRDAARSFVRGSKRGVKVIKSMT